MSTSPSLPPSWQHCQQVVHHFLNSTGNCSVVQECIEAAQAKSSMFSRCGMENDAERWRKTAVLLEAGMEALRDLDRLRDHTAGDHGRLLLRQALQLASGLEDFAETPRPGRVLREFRELHREKHDSVLDNLAYWHAELLLAELHTELLRFWEKQAAPLREALRQPSVQATLGQNLMERLNRHLMLPLNAQQTSEWRMMFESNHGIRPIFALKQTLADIGEHLQNNRQPAAAQAFLQAHAALAGSSIPELVAELATHKAYAPQPGWRSLFD
jgi:hypothetical protein